MKTKKILSFILSLAIIGTVLANLTVASAAVTTTEIAGTSFSYTVDSEKSTIVINGEGEMPLNAGKLSWRKVITNYETITIGEGITEIPQSFANSVSTVKTVNFPSTLVKIGSKCFQSSSVETLNFDGGMKNLSFGSYALGSKVTTITLKGESERFTVVDNCLYSKDKSVLYIAPTSASFTLPNNVKRAVVVCSGKLKLSSSNFKTAIDSDLELEVCGFKDGKQGDEFILGELLEAKLTSKTNKNLDDIIYSWYPITSKGAPTSATGSNIVGFESSDSYISDEEVLLSPKAKYAATKNVTDIDTKTFRCVACRMNEQGVLNVVAYKDFTIDADETTYKIDALKDLATGNSVTMVKGETREIAELLGRCGLTHVTTCAKITDIVAPVTSNITVNGTKITANENIANISVAFKLSTTSCAFHDAIQDVDADLIISIIEEPIVEATCSTITVSNLVDGYDYYLDDVKGEVKDKKITFTGLTDSTNYILRLGLTGKVGEESAPYSVEVSTTDHPYSTDWTCNDSKHWHKATCEHSTLIKDEDAHTGMEDNICDVCGYVRPTFTTTADAGFYGADENSAENGVIAFTSFITNLEDVTNLTDFGYCFYYGETLKAEKSSDLTTDLSTKSACYYSLIDSIATGDFDKVVVAKPFAKVNGDYIYGNTFSCSVNTYAKWLGEQE